MPRGHGSKRSKELSDGIDQSLLGVACPSGRRVVVAVDDQTTHPCFILVVAGVFLSSRGTGNESHDEGFGLVMVGLLNSLTGLCTVLILLLLTAIIELALHHSQSLTIRSASQEHWGHHQACQADADET
jgi:hypothetical protein